MQDFIIPPRSVLQALPGWKLCQHFTILKACRPATKQGRFIIPKTIIQHLQGFLNTLKPGRPHKWAQIGTIFISLPRLILTDFTLRERHNSFVSSNGQQCKLQP